MKPWDYHTAFRLMDEAETVVLPEDYDYFRPFYQLSMLYEIFLKMPEYKTDQDLLQEMANLKGMGNTYWYSYGLLHNHEVEPFQQWLEHELNQDGFLPATADAWMELYNIYTEPRPSTRVFDQSTPAMVIKVRGNIGWNFFAIRQGGSGRFTVQSLYPEWKKESWNDETFQITDLNANGRDEIAVEYYGWGTGMSHFCVRDFKVYEWDGSEFQNLFADELYFGTGTEHGDCLPITFPPDTNGRKMVQTGITYNTVCPDEPYQKIITFRWDDLSFREQPKRTSQPPATNVPNRCTIEWAMDAGRENDTAVVLLENALSNWPLEAEQEWGPAARDFLRFYLATWYIERNQMEQGLTLLTEVRDKPFTPEYPLPSKLAKIFLDAYQTMGLYSAVNEVEERYSDEQPCSYEGCHAEKMRETWGYFEHDWEYEYPKYLFTEDFTRIGSLNRVLQQERPSSLNELNQIFDRNKLHPVWSVQGDMDGQGEEDWLLTVKDERGEDGCPIFKFYAYLQNETGSDLVYLYMLDYSIGSEYCGNVIDYEPSRWRNFSADTITGPINVLETPYEISSFRFVEEDGKTEIKEVLSLSKKLYWVDSDPGLLIYDWSVDNGRLIIQYTDRQVAYTWSADGGKLVPTGTASELQEENIAKAEQAIYIDNQPNQAIEILNGMLKERVWENYDGRYGFDEEPSKIRPYALYLLGLAYEQASDSENAVRAYWQLWHEYPTNPYSIAAQSKLERR